MSAIPTPQKSLIQSLCLLLAFLALTPMLTSCLGDDEDSQALFNDLKVIAPKEDGVTLATRDLENLVVASINEATLSIDAAFEHLESEPIAQALIAAHERGVKVRFVSDEDSKNQLGVKILLDALGRVPEGRVSLGNGSIDYSPQPSLILTRPGNMNRMTHNFLLFDEKKLINLSGGFWKGTEDIREIAQIAFVAVSEDLTRDFGDEFEQMYGGVFATTLDTFNGPTKSNSNPRISYPMTDGDLELYFGPQEKTLKKAIDEIYAARASIDIVTEEFNNDFIVKALINKSATGFKVRVLLDRDALASNQARLDELLAGFAKFETDAEVRVADNIKQTMIVIDADRSPIDGKRYQTRAMILSQPLVATIPFNQIGFGGDSQFEELASDVFFDSNMWVLNQYPTEDEPQVVQLVLNFRRLFDAASVQ